jgi:dTDP-3-amino-3,4,6-trideoxy-alpha-D-glucose transaminase
VNVPFLDLTLPPDHQAEIASTLTRVAASGRYLLGPELEAFETEFAAFAGARHCVAVGSGLDALRLSLQARGIGPGDEVIVPGQTFIATWLAVSAVGATPVPVDVEPHSHLIDVAQAAAAIGPRTAAILAVDLYGHPADHVALRELADRHGLWLLDDAAQAHGARLHDRPASSWSDAAAWSFYPGKNLGALGDGGAVTTNDALLARHLRRLRNYGSEQKYHHVERGSNSRLDELQAAVLRVKLRRFDETAALRAEVALRYRISLSTATMELPHVAAGAEPSWHLFVVRTDRRDELRAHLAARGVETVIHYPIPPHRQVAYADTPLAAAHLPVTDRAAAEVLSLPMGPHLDRASVAAVIGAVHEFSPYLPAALAA